jgi:hypothetical protein
MKSYIKSVLTGCFFVSAFLFSSCKKESSDQSATVTDEESQTMSQENAAADGEYDEITEIALTADADLAIAATEPDEVPGTAAGTGVRIRTPIFKQLGIKLGPCAEVSVSGDEFPKTVTIDYGDGCVCFDGKFRKGAVILHFMAPLRRSGSVLTITLRDFHVNRAHIEGVKTISNLSTGNGVKFAVSIEDGMVSWPNGRGFTYVGTKTVTQIAGMDTRGIKDDIYEIERRNKTVYANGVTVVKNTDTPLIRKISCPWLVQGILKVKINNGQLFLNYGNGDCDNKAVLSWRGGEKEVSLN